MPKHKKQHSIPVCYLNAWTDPSRPKNHAPYVWVFSKDGGNVRKKAPKNIFHETDMYTITTRDGQRDLVLEHGLMQLESEFAAIRNRKLKRQLPLNLTEHLKICAFIAAMQGRTRASRAHYRKEWERPLKMMEGMIDWAKTATPEERKRAAAESPGNSSRRSGLSYEQVKALVEKPLQNILPAMISASTPLLCKLDFAVLTTTDNIGFITSDHPCVWFDPQAYKRPPLLRTPALCYKSIEITLPVSPALCICLNRRGISGYLPMPQNVVDDLNRRTRFYADDYFVVRTNEKREFWFDPGTEPEDSWEKTQQ